MNVKPQIIIGMGICLLSLGIMAQEGQAVPSGSQDVKSAKEQSAETYQEFIWYISASFPRVRQALDKQIKDGQPNEGITNWLKLLEILNNWPQDQKATQADIARAHEEMKKKADEMMKELSEQGGQSEQPKKPTPPKK
jgi:hypothetical protein